MALWNVGKYGDIGESDGNDEKRKTKHPQEQYNAKKTTKRLVEKNTEKIEP